MVERHSLKKIRQKVQEESLIIEDWETVNKESLIKEDIENNHDEFGKEFKFK